MGSNSVNVGAYIGFIFVVTFMCCVYLVFKYAEQGFPKHTYVTCVIGYFCTFALMLIVPIDLAAVIIDRRNNNNSTYHNDFSQLVGIYNGVFIPILVLSNLVLVFEEYYNTDGIYNE